MCLCIFQELFGTEGVEVVIHYLRTNSSFLNSGLGHHRLLLSAVDCVWSVSYRVNGQDSSDQGGFELRSFVSYLVILLYFLTFKIGCWLFFSVFFLSFFSSAKWPLSEDTESYAHALRNFVIG